MTRPRMSRALVAQIAKQKRDAEVERISAGIERRMTSLAQIAERVLLMETARDKGQLSKARYEQMGQRVMKELEAIRLDQERDRRAYVEPPAMKS